MATMIFGIAFGATVLLLVHGLLRGSTGMKLLCGFIVILLIASVVPWYSVVDV